MKKILGMFFVLLMLFPVFGSAETCVEEWYCDHNHVRETESYTYTRYTPYNPDDHQVKITYKKYCEDCGEVFDISTIYDNDAHVWNASGRCKYCGESGRGR